MSGTLVREGPLKASFAALKESKIKWRNAWAVLQFNELQRRHNLLLFDKRKASKARHVVALLVADVERAPEGECGGQPYCVRLRTEVSELLLVRPRRTQVFRTRRKRCARLFLFVSCVALITNRFARSHFGVFCRRPRRRSSASSGSWRLSAASQNASSKLAGGCAAQKRVGVCWGCRYDISNTLCVHGVCVDSDQSMVSIARQEVAALRTAKELPALPPASKRSALPALPSTPAVSANFGGGGMHDSESQLMMSSAEQLSSDASGRSSPTGGSSDRAELPGASDEPTADEQRPQRPLPAESPPPSAAQSAVVRQQNSTEYGHVGLLLARGSQDDAAKKKRNGDAASDGSLGDELAPVSVPTMEWTDNYGKFAALDAQKGTGADGEAGDETAGGAPDETSERSSASKYASHYQRVPHASEPRNTVVLNEKSNDKIPDIPAKPRRQIAAKVGATAKTDGDAGSPALHAGLLAVQQQSFDTLSSIRSVTPPPPDDDDDTAAAAAEIRSVMDTSTMESITPPPPDESDMGTLSSIDPPPPADDELDVGATSTTIESPPPSSADSASNRVHDAQAAPPKPIRAGGAQRPPKPQRAMQKPQKPPMRRSKSNAARTNAGRARKAAAPMYDSVVR